MKNIMKKTLAAALSVLMLCGGIPSSLSGIPVFENALTAEAAGSVSFDSTGVLTLSGNITKDEVRLYANDESVKTVIASSGTVLPSDCSSLFEEFEYAETIKLGNADTSNVTNMYRMFN